ncbi:NAD(P)-binding protein [Hortaea werneckii]|nr:NAD(P)-binding protein [Hortaea werneckii]
MSAKIGVAIIGSGIFVKEEHLPAVQACEQLDLKAIYSRSLKSAQSVSESLSQIDLYSDDSDKSYPALLSRQDIHAVIIALPIPVQPDFIKQALTAGKHVLAEKPLAKDVATGKALLDWYHSNIDTKQVTFGVAEQFRYLDAFLYAAEKVRGFGRVLGFRHKLGASIQPGAKYFETAWRKTPEYQGGFLLDGGVHFVAGMRLLLGPEAKVDRLSAFTQQLQPHLVPVDTVDATLRLANGSTGTFSVSFGTTFSGASWEVACEGGSVRVEGKEVVITPKGGEEVKEEKPEALGSGVKAEVFAWAESIVSGKQDDQQKPEEALADLECLEAMLKSGERGGEPVSLQYQI